MRTRQTHRIRKAVPVRSQRGLSMIELMVAMTIGAVLLFGATQVYVNSQKSYGVNETVARLQENARYAMSVIEPDVREASYWGLLNDPTVIVNAAPQTAPAGAVAPGAGANACGTNFAIDLTTTLQGDNDGYVLSPTRTAACDALPDITSGVVWATTPVTTADTLVVRRASTLPTNNVPSPATLQVCTSRSGGFLVSDGTGCAITGVLPPVVLLSNLSVNAYYVDQNSLQQAGMPSLRRKVVTSNGAAIVFREQEVMAGVEDMQVQFGIDPGVTGVVQRYVDPGGVPAGAQIVAVRVWLLVRADAPETGFTDTTIYQYGNRSAVNGVTGDLNAAAGAGMAYQPSLNPNATLTGPQHVRHLLISRTIQVRNALIT